MPPSSAPMSNGTYLMPSNSSFPTIPSVEEISTIFVVGFPDDMLEREFQNMFLFSPGFEAATLKLPSKDQDEDSARRQIIGFAKFHTRMEALEARNVLNGRRIDADKGCVLKAEMAKKNLHTKRASANEMMTPTSTSTSLSATTAPQVGATIIPYSLSQPTTAPANASGSNNTKRLSLSAYEAFHAASTLSNELPLSSGTSTAVTAGPFSPGSSVFALRAQSFDAQSVLVNEVSNGRWIMPSTSTSTMNSGLNSRHSYPFDLEGELGYLSKSTPTHTDFRGTPLFAPRTFSPSTSTTPAGLASVLEEFFSPLDMDGYDDDLTMQMAGISMNTSSSSTSAGGPLASPTGLTSHLYRPFGTIGSTNPADHNPPCNTLYVGNLPPNTDEDELVTMFAKCIGYKRHSFRSKPNGPMCFVEFNDVSCASQALQDLHGNPLSNSAKGGIRLSYSKNPLGVRQNSISNSALPMPMVNSSNNSLSHRPHNVLSFDSLASQ